MKKLKEKQKITKKKEEGITLIALVVTIIVLLILAGVSIAMLTGEGGILKQAGEARERTGRANIIEQARVDLLEKQTQTKGKISKEDLLGVLNKYFDGVPELEDEVWKNEEEWKKEEVTGKNDKTVNVEIGEIYGGTLGENPPSSVVPSITVNGEIVTKEEFDKDPKKYLGKVVTNFKDTSTETETVSGVTVSTKYRLYYVDFDDSKGDGKGKYGDGVGTIYLKADCISDGYCHFKLDETNTAENDGIRIKQLNPSLYAEGKKAPEYGNMNMQAVTWTLNEKNWSELKGLLKPDGITLSDINYIVGAPSLEMMVDSYNTYYNLTGEKLDYTPIQEGERRKLFYRYNNDSDGYQVGPCEDNEDGFGNITLYNSVWKDYKIDTMYYPGDEDNAYWLGSPSARGYDIVYLVRGDWRRFRFRFG